MHHQLVSKTENASRLELTEESYQEENDVAGRAFTSVGSGAGGVT